MAYRMPNQYAAEDDDSEYSEQDASVMDLSVDTTAEDDDEDDHGVDEGSVAEYDEDLSEYSEEDDPRAHRRGGGGGGHHSAIRSTGEPPRRAKSFDGDARHHASSSSRGGGGSGQLDRGGAVERKANSHHERGGSRRTPARGKSFDSGRRQPSMRSLGGPKMRRDTSTKMDKEAIASNRARRLRAMGGGDTGSHEKVNLLRRSQSFRGPGKSKSLLEEENEDDDAEEKEDNKKGGDKEPRRRLPPRTKSNDLSSLPPEERQYARTAARGVTRSKSLKAERPNLDKASKNVASRLQAMRTTGAGTPSRSSGASGRRGERRNGSSGGDGAAEAAAPKAVGLQW